MTPTQRRNQLAKYVRALANQMGMRDWTVTLRPEPPEDSDEGYQTGFGVIADSFVPPGQQHAILRMREDVQMDGDLNYLREVFVHELVHCLLWPYARTIRTVKPELSQPTYDVWLDNLKHSEEQAVDQIARAWAPLLPLPL
jgi:hypothetical protein